MSSIKIRLRSEYVFLNYVNRRIFYVEYKKWYHFTWQYYTCDRDYNKALDQYSKMKNSILELGNNFDWDILRYEIIKTK